VFAGTVLLAPALVVFASITHLVGAVTPHSSRPERAAAHVPARAPASPSRAATSPWVAAWTVAPVPPGPAASAIPFSGGTGGRTVRDVVHLTLGGTEVRVRLSNVFGSRTATFTDVRVAIARGAGGGETVPGTSRRLRFGGATTARVPAGRIVASDPIRLAIGPGANVAVSIYAPHATGRSTNSGDVDHTNYVSAAGDVASSTAPASFPEAVSAWYWLGGVDVRPHNPRAGAIVALGDSITAGYDSTPDADRDWPDRLADRLRAAHARPPLAVLNAGISGNNLSRSSPCFGQSGLQRMQRDAFDQPGVRDVIVALGVNDITQPHEPRSAGAYVCLPHRPISAAGLIADYRIAIRRIHAHHLRAIGATITPFGRYRYWTPAIEAERERVNNWIRTSHAFDGVIDFDRALRDPSHPTWLKPAYDGGDGLHPDDAGHAAMARAIPLSLFTGR
jgi:lysophospholipase L1-like esterase